MDDGSKIQNTLKISTNSFCYSDIEMITKVLLEKKIELIALRDKILEPDFFEHYQNKLKNNSNKAFTGWWNNILTNK